MTSPTDLTLDDRLHDALQCSLAGIVLARRFVGRMPSDTHAQRAARADADLGAVRVMRMGEWRPTFPYLPPQRRPLVTS